MCKIVIMNKILITIVVIVALAGAWWFLRVNTDTPIVMELPVHKEEKAEPPNLPKPPSFVERVLKDNPHISRETAEQYETERIQTNVAHQEYRVQVLKEKNVSNPEEMIAIEQELARELQAQFEKLEEKYNINMAQGKPGFTGAPIPATLPN
jgi:anti-sigma-K factor RskA